VETAEAGARQALAGVDDLLEAEPEPTEPAPEPEPQKPKAGKQEAKVDRRPFEERSVEELRDRARELDIEGRSTMSKDELVAALRQHAR
jgi:Rho termination factor, N-terminal domain